MVQVPIIMPAAAARFLRGGKTNRLIFRCRTPLLPTRRSKKAVHMIRLKRAYAPAAADDGLRVLVERLWPRGVSKEKAAIDLWLKDLAPSTELRKWFHQDPQRWDEFRKRYRAELQQQTDLLAQLQQHLAEGTVTFIFGASDADHNSAVVLKEYLEKHND